MKSNIKKSLHSDRTFDIIVNLLGALVILIVLVPLIFVLAASFSDPDLVIKGKVLFCRKALRQKHIRWFLKIRISGEDSGTAAFIR